MLNHHALGKVSSFEIAWFSIENRESPVSVQNKAKKKKRVQIFGQSNEAKMQNIKQGKETCTTHQRNFSGNCDITGLLPIFWFKPVEQILWEKQVPIFYIQDKNILQSRPLVLWVWQKPHILSLPIASESNITNPDQLQKFVYPGNIWIYWLLVFILEYYEFEKRSVQLCQ